MSRRAGINDVAGQGDALRGKLRVVSIAELRAMPAEEFEQTIAFLLQTLGFQVDDSEGNQLEGVDLVAWDSEEHPWIVRFERERDITEPMVREFHAFIRRHDVERGVILTTEGLHEEARAWTRRALLYLWSGERLQKMLQLAGGKRWHAPEGQ